MAYKLQPLSLLTITILTALGCAGASDRPATFPVRGTITYRGKPVSDASVSFLATGAPRPAAGITDQDGNFTLSTYGVADGAVVGEHVVTVTKVAAPASAEAESQPASIEEAMQQSAAAAQKARSVRSDIPRMYADHRTTDLRIAVEAKDNAIQIELKD
jgi:hypothetical protein